MLRGNDIPNRIEMNTASGILGSKAWRCGSSIALMALLAAAAVHAARLGLADTYEQAAALEIERWGTRQVGPQELTRATGFVAESLRLEPRHPSALEDLGWLQLREIRSATDSRLASDLARGAYSNFRLALAEGPTSSLNWARLALTKLYLAEQDEELFASLRSSLELGPRDPGVPELVLHLGLALWPKADPELRRKVVRALNLSASRDAKIAFAIGESYGRFDLMCDINTLRAMARDACEQIHKTD